MDAISANYSFPDAIKLVITSGTDVMLLKMKLVNYRSPVDMAVNIVTMAIVDGEIPETRIDESFSRIMKMKREYLNPAFVDNNYKDKTLPSKFSLTNFPNPFNPSTNIVINLSQPSDVSLSIYNTAGQTVGELMNKRFPPLVSSAFTIPATGHRESIGLFSALLQAWLREKLFLLSNIIKRSYGCGSFYCCLKPENYFN